MGYTGEGTYTLGTCKYIGEIKDGKFHGKGTCYVKGSGKWVGMWENGKLVDGNYVIKPQ